MEEKNIDELLSEEIAAQIKALSDLQSGTKEKSTAIDDLTKLYKLRIEENKSVWDADEKYNRRMMDGESVTKDNDFKERQSWYCSGRIIDSVDVLWHLDE